MDTTLPLTSMSAPTDNRNRQTNSPKTLEFHENILVDFKKLIFNIYITIIQMNRHQTIIVQRYLLNYKRYKTMLVISKWYWLLASTRSFILIIVSQNFTLKEYRCQPSLDSWSIVINQSCFGIDFMQSNDPLIDRDNIFKQGL